MVVTVKTIKYSYLNDLQDFANDDSNFKKIDAVISLGVKFADFLAVHIKKTIAKNVSIFGYTSVSSDSSILYVYSY